MKISKFKYFNLLFLKINFDKFCSDYKFTILLARKMAFKFFYFDINFVKWTFVNFYVTKFIKLTLMKFYLEIMIDIFIII